MPDFRLQFFQNALIFKHLQTGFDCGAAKGISRVAMTVGERFTVGHGAIEHQKQFVRDQSNIKRKLSSRQTFTQDHPIRSDAFMLCRNHSAPLAKAGHDFVND